MNLTEADKNKVTNWLNSKCGQMRCVCCGNGKWQLIDMATLPIGIDLHTTRFFYHAGVPQVCIACEHCAHMVYFNAAIMGFKADEPAAAT